MKVEEVSLQDIYDDFEKRIAEAKLSNKLKHCPFCREDAEMMHYTLNNGKFNYTVRCSACGVETVAYDQPYQARVFWNMRLKRRREFVPYWDETPLPGGEADGEKATSGTPTSEPQQETKRTKKNGTKKKTTEQKGTEQNGTD